MKKKTSVGLVLLVFAGVTLFCSTPQKDTRPQILVSPKGLVHSFWLTVKAGADSAGEEFDANVIWKGPSVETDIATQIGILEDYINKDVDAIVLAACDANALNPALQKADEAGIPVVTIDSGVDSDIPRSLIATDNVLAAKKAADAIAELTDGSGQVALIPFVPGAATSNMRENGFKEGLKAYPGLELVSVQYSQSDVERAMAVTEDILTAHPNLYANFAANEAGAIGCVQALKGRHKTGTVKLVAFDASPNQIAALKDGSIQALVVQNPFAMGYQGVKTALTLLEDRPVDRRIDTGVTVVTLDNLNDAKVQRLLASMTQ